VLRNGFIDDLGITANQTIRARATEPSQAHHHGVNAMTDDHLKQLTDLIEAAHFAPDDDCYLGMVVDNLLALREGQEKQTALLEALVDGQLKMLQLLPTSLAEKGAPTSQARSSITPRPNRKAAA
jgi:hypothetical protein